MHVVLFAGGTIRPGSAVEQALAHPDLIIAADSGALSALALGLLPAFVVGDLDSLPASVLARVQEQGSQVIPALAEKDETDTELAIDLALERGATRVTILGALGGDRF